nr:MAG TPA: hypothetical protein [Caudoviricetes sp.]
MLIPFSKNIINKILLLISDFPNEIQIDNQEY